jgi:hypothetical protein
MKKGRCGTMTHDYKRHGTTTLFAALNVLDGAVIGRCMQRHRHPRRQHTQADSGEGQGRLADTAQSTVTEALAGLVERVTFHNAENGFCVLRVKARGQRDLVTVVGHAAMITAGEFVQLSGTWVNDRTHGQPWRRRSIALPCNPVHKHVSSEPMTDSVELLCRITE